jgi:tetratricopeptide (TPR) repeat protein
MRVEGRAERGPRLTAAIIVKDEAEHLAGCLASIRGVVDEIVVVDTGSADHSAAVAAGFGAIVLHHDWTGSFSDARNIGLDRATGEWILYIDADERLEAPAAKADLDALLDWADTSRVGAFQVHFTLLQGCSHAYEWRLWRHDPAVRFEGIIHESVTLAIRSMLARDGAVHRETDVVRLVHYGYEGDQMRKHERNLPLLLAEAERTPTRPYLWNHLGRILEALDRPDEARAMWDRAIVVVRETEPSKRSLVDSLSHADVVLRAAEAGRDESALLAEALALFPMNWVIRWAAAVDALNKRDYEGAVARAREIVDARPEDIHRGGVTYPTRLFADWPHHLIGMCRFEQGRFAEAAEAFDRAHSFAPDVSEYAVKARLARARAGATVSP